MYMCSSYGLLQLYIDIFFLEFSSFLTNADAADVNLKMLIAFFIEFPVISPSFYFSAAIELFFLD
jgi:hypothetical protein